MRHTDTCAHARVHGRRMQPSTGAGAAGVVDKLLALWLARSAWQQQAPWRRPWRPPSGRWQVKRSGVRQARRQRQPAHGQAPTFARIRSSQQAHSESSTSTWHNTTCKSGCCCTSGQPSVLRTLFLGGSDSAWAQGAVKASFDTPVSDAKGRGTECSAAAIGSRSGAGEEHVL